MSQQTQLIDLIGAGNQIRTGDPNLGKGLSNQFSPYLSVTKPTRQQSNVSDHDRSSRGVTRFGYTLATVKIRSQNPGSTFNQSTHATQSISEDTLASKAADQAAMSSLLESHLLRSSTLWPVIDQTANASIQAAYPPADQSLQDLHAALLLASARIQRVVPAFSLSRFSALIQWLKYRTALRLVYPRRLVGLNPYCALPGEVSSLFLKHRIQSCYLPLVIFHYYSTNFFLKMLTSLRTATTFRGIYRET